MQRDANLVESQDCLSFLELPDTSMTQLLIFILALADFSESDEEDEKFKEPKKEPIKNPIASNNANSVSLLLKCDTIDIDNIGVMECYQIRLTVSHTPLPPPVNPVPFHASAFQLISRVNSLLQPTLSHQTPRVHDL